MAVRSHHDRYDSVAPYVRTFAHLKSRRRHRLFRRVPRLELRTSRVGLRLRRLGLVCTAALAVAISIRKDAASEAPVVRTASPQGIADTRQAAAVARPEMAALPADAPPFVSDVEHAPPEAPMPGAEAPPAEPQQAPQMAEVRGPEPQAVPIGPPVAGADVGSAAPARRSARPRPAAAFSVYAIRRLLDRYAVEAESDQPEGVQELDVHAHLLSIREVGNRTVVRFTRRHRYRDALGRLVMRETPPMQTTVVRTAGGVRFETPPI